MPKKDPSIAAAAIWNSAPVDDKRTLLIEIIGKGANWDFYPYGSKNFEIEGETKLVSAEDGKVRLEKKAKKLKGEWPGEISGLLVQHDGETTGYEVRIPIAASSGETAVAIANAALETPSVSLPFALFFAFLGGLILNVMPCVLPVISLKIFSFVSQSRDDPRRVRSLGLVYGLGVLVSFLVLAILAIAAKKAGDVATWGMVLQNQQFRVVMTVLVTLVALNLFGVFEVTASGRVMGAAGDLSSKEGMPGAFFNGALATILATPCTAPFLGSALAFAFTQSTVVILLIFLCIGLGLAAPFVLLCWNPGWLKLLPKPGAWMEKFKIAMGFPLLATAVWLFWFTAPRFGKTGVLWMGLFLVILAAAVWVWGEFVQRGSRRKGLAVVIALLLLGGGYLYALESKLSWRTQRTVSAAEGVTKESPDGIEWRTWSPEAVAKARSEGHPVLVDFTADNCLNCQVNKIRSLEVPQTRAKLKELGVVAFLGDFTDKDRRIAEELQRYQRSGVPLVLIFPADPSKPAIVLPPVLFSPQPVIEALEKAAE